MKQLVTALAFIAIGFMWTQSASAQITDVTIRQINAIDADSIAALNAAGASLQDADMIRLLFDSGTVSRGDTVRIGAVVLSDPRNSGLASPDGDGVPGRIHIFIRDTTAATAGNAGNGIQIVDGNFQTTGTLGLEVGDVIELVATVAPFNETMQLSPQSFNLLGTYQDLGLPDTILDPDVVVSSDLNRSVGGAGEQQVNWDNVVAYRQSYVRLENVTVVARDISSDRPAFLLTSDAGATVVTNRDISLRFRNDRDNYSSDFNVRDSNDDFVPPPPGSVVNIQGFTVIYDFENFSRATPFMMMVSPMEDGDLETVVGPPIISSIERPTIPDTNPVDITADVVADPARTVASVELKYYTSASADTATVASGAPTGDNYGFQIPAAGDGDYVTFWIEATDDQGATSRSEDEVYLVLADGINEIADIQTTQSGDDGPSPFRNANITTTISAVVQTDGAASGIWSLQDNASLDPWTGIEIRTLAAASPVPALGDQVTVNSALVTERFGLTVLDSVVVTIDGTGSPYPHKLVSTDVLQDPAVSEAHEGMLLRFEDVTITNNDEGFGEWSFSSDGTSDNAIFADDASDEFAQSYATDTFVNDDVVSYIQGLWSYTFSNYKLFPIVASDVGDINVGVDELLIAEGYSLGQNYPNPFSGSTAIVVTTPKNGEVTLAVYDVLGRHVSTLVDGIVPAGEHVVDFDRRGLASGLYMYRLTVDGRSLVRTMTLLK